MRRLDHIVHAVRDLEAAAALYERLGFLVGARNRHPWGTHNRIVQFAGAFVELLEVAEPEKIPAPAPQRFSFGAFNRKFLERGDGLSMLALASEDAEADAATFRQAGVGDFEVFRFRREATRADGSTAAVAFSLAFTEDIHAPEAGFFACQHHHPENFWNAAFQAHPNGATGMAGVVLVAENPPSHRQFFCALVGENDVQPCAAGLHVAMERSSLDVIDPATFHARFGTELPRTGAQLAALRFIVRDEAHARTVLESARLELAKRDGALIVPPHLARGATLVFEAGR